MSVPLSFAEPNAINDRGHLLEILAQQWAEQLAEEATAETGDHEEGLRRRFRAATAGWVEHRLTLDEAVQITNRGAWLYGQGEPS